MFSTLHKKITQHLAYMRTRNALENMPEEIARDLNIDRRHAAEQAARDVYGQ